MAPPTLEQKQNDAVWRFCSDLLLIPGNFLLPAAVPLGSLAHTSYRVATGKEDFLEASPRIVFGIFSTIPSLASGAFVTPMALAKTSLYAEEKCWFKTAGWLRKTARLRFWSGAQYLVETSGIGRAAKVLGFLSLPFVVYSMVTAVADTFVKIKEASRQETTALTVAATAASNLLLIGMTLFSSAILPPRWKPERDANGGLVRGQFEEPRERVFSGTKVEMVRGFRRLFDTALKSFYGYNPRNRAYESADKVHSEFDRWVLWMMGRQRFDVRGGEVVTRAVAQGKLVLNISLSHGEFADFAAMDLAVRSLRYRYKLGPEPDAGVGIFSVRHGYLMKKSLLDVAPAARMTTARLGRQLVVINRNDIADGALKMWEGHTMDYGRPNGMVYTIFAPLTRTASGKNEMANRTATQFVVMPDQHGVRQIDNAPCGPDDPLTIWQPHRPPFDYALELARQHPGQVEVVFSVIEYGDRSQTIRFLAAPRPLHEYATRIGKQIEIRPGGSAERAFPGTLSQADVADEFRGDIIRWIINHLLPGSSYFRRYVDSYYWIDQRGILGKNVGG